MKKVNLLSKAEMKRVMGGGDITEEDDGEGASPKVEACEGKKSNETCSWAYGNRVITGKCTSYMAQAMHCSDLL